MNFIIFQFRRFLTFLADSFIFPFFKFRELWADPTRGRSMIFGLPALLVALCGTGAIIVALFSHDRFLSNYEVALKKSESKKEWNEAIVYMQKIMQLRPDDPQTKWELARVLNKDESENAEGNRRRALSILNKLSPDSEPGFPMAHVWRANQYLSLPSNVIPLSIKMSKAEQHLQFALDTDPDNQDARIVLAERILIPQKKYQEALDVYEELFEQYPAYYIKIAELHGALGKRDAAIPVIEEAIQKYLALLEDDSDNLNYLRRLARAHAMMDNHEKGIEILTEAMNRIESPSDKKQLRIAISQTYLSMGMRFANATRGTSEAAKAAQSDFLDIVIKAYHTYPENEAAQISLTRYGFSELEDAPRALEAYDARDNIEEATAAALQYAGTYELVKGDRLLGIRMLEKAVQKNPRNHESMNNLAFSIMDSDLPRSLQLVNKALGIFPTKAEYYDTRANIFMRMENWESATNDFEQAVKLWQALLRNSGKEPPVKIYEALVECYRQQGMISMAASYQNKVDELQAKEASEVQTNPNN